MLESHIGRLLEIGYLLPLIVQAVDEMLILGAWVTRELVLSSMCLVTLDVLPLVAHVALVLLREV